MPAKQSQVNAERIDAILELIEDSGSVPPQAAAELKEVRGIGEASDVADNHRNNK